jgi:hypothetical protein
MAVKNKRSALFAGRLFFLLSRVQKRICGIYKYKKLSNAMHLRAQKLFCVSVNLCHDNGGAV